MPFVALLNHHARTLSIDHVEQHIEHFVKELDRPPILPPRKGPLFDTSSITRHNNGGNATNNDLNQL